MVLEVEKIVLKGTVVEGDMDMDTIVAMEGMDKVVKGQGLVGLAQPVHELVKLTFVPLRYFFRVRIALINKSF